ncbi:MAG: DUF2332 domain-containing protein [Rhodopila sp.]
MTSQSDLINAFRTQSRACESLGSQFMAALLQEAASEFERSGSIGGLLRSWPGDPVADAVPLRLAAALHALVLSGHAPELAKIYPAADQSEPAADVWRAAMAAIAAQRSVVATFLDSPPQTNEVGRSAVLLGGFLEIARATAGRPMRILEIGASAGLIQIWDHYRYHLGGTAQWGPPESPVVVEAAWSGPPPPLDASIAIAERVASDSAPVDLDDPEACLRLRAYVWADQSARMALLDAAMALARQLRVHVKKAEAGGWVADHLGQPAAGRTTVLYHSIAWEYFPDETKTRITGALAQVGQRGTAESPLAWLRLEPPAGSGPGGGEPELRLTLWPGGQDQRLATAHTHGPPVTWIGARADA